MNASSWNFTSPTGIPHTCSPTSGSETSNAPLHSWMPYPSNDISSTWLTETITRSKFLIKDSNSNECFENFSLSTKKSFDDLFRVLRDCNEIQALILTNVGMADHHLSTICENKSICKKLRRAKFLDLSNNLLTEEGINILHSKVFYKDCSTQILDLSGNSILDSDAVTAPTPQHASHRLLSYRLSCSSLTHLRLSHLDLELVSHVVQAFPYIQSLIIWNLSPFRHAAKPGIISKSPVEKSFYDLCKALKCSTPLMELEIYSDKSFWVLARKVLAFKTVTMGGDDAGWKNVLLWRKHLNQCLKARTDPLKRFHWTGITDFKQHHHDVAD